MQVPQPEDGWNRLQQLIARARQASDELAREGRRALFVRLIFVPEEDVCFFLYEAASRDAVRQAARRADLTFDAILEASEDRSNE